MSGSVGGINAAIPLQAQTQTTADPMGALGTMMKLRGEGISQQNAQIQQQLLQTQSDQMRTKFDAQKKAGAIISAAPSFEAGMDAVLKDPETAAFAGEQLTQLRQMQQLQVGTTGTMAGQNRDAFQAILKGSMSAVNEPGQLEGAIQTQLAGMPEGIRGRIMPMVKTWTQSLTHDLPKDPAEAMQVYKQRLAAMMIGAGVPMDAINGVTGTPTTRDTGGGIQSGVQLPGPQGGAFVPANTTGKTLAPQITKLPVGDGSEQNVVMGGDPSSSTLGVPGLSTAPPTSISAGAGTPLSNSLGVRPIGGKTLTPDTEAYQKEVGHKSAELEEDLGSDLKGLPGALKQVNMLQDTLKNFQSGGLTDIRGEGGKILQGLQNMGVKIPEYVVQGVANGSLASNQVFSALIKPMVINTLKESAAGTGRVMRSEVDAFLQMMDGTSDPEALMTLLNRARTSMNISYDRSKKFVDFKQKLASGDPSTKGMNMLNYPQWYTAQYKESDLPTQNDAGEQMGPRPITDAKGVVKTDPAQPGKKFLWDPKAGKLVETP